MVRNRKIIGTILSIVLIFGMVCALTPELRFVQASSEKGETADGVYYVSYEKANAEAIFGSQEQIPIADGLYKNWLFAGWYEDNTCKKPIRTANAIPEEGAYAKFVNPDVMSIKLQNGANAEDAEATKTNMRIVSSVDSLNYRKVGFEVTKQGESTRTVDTSTVYERIVANATSGVEYQYSPKTVGTESEYFVTVTILNIIKEDYNKEYLIKPFWETLDGVKVYGVSRNASVNDGINSKVINTSVAAELTVDGSYNVTYGETGTASAKVLSQNGAYANIRITLPKDRGTLNSVTKFTIENGDADVTVFYRNLETTYAGSGTEDESWFTEYDNSVNKYIIATSADLYGLASLANSSSKTFSGKEIYVISDIILNKGTASVESGWVPNENGGTAYEWTAVKNFAGTFDGQHHTISGINGKTASGITGTGLFTKTNGATIQNLYIKNSYFLATTNSGLGAVIGQGNGIVRNVYSNAVLVESKALGAIGGILGCADGNVEISNCWNESDITTSKTYCGGIMGTVTNTGFTITIAHCLNTGDLTFTGTGNSYFGGMVGRANNANGTAGMLTVRDCLNLGLVHGTQKETYMGGILGFGSTQNGTNATSVIENSYTMKHYNENDEAVGVTSIVGAYANRASISNSKALEQEKLRGENATSYTTLDFVKAGKNGGAWVARNEKTPIPNCFVSETDEVIQTWFSLESDNTGTISNVEELYSFASQMNAGMLGVNNETVIRLTDNIEVNTNANAQDWATGTAELPTSWTPIAGFEGTFDGQGYTISGIYSNTNYRVGSTSYGTGLFTNTNQATIQNLKITNSFFDVTTSAGTGAVVGLGTGTLKNIYTDVIITDESTSTKGRIGGIVGKANGDLVIENCWSNCDIESKWEYVGGILGYGNAKNVTIKHCYNTGDLTYTGTEDSYFGGIMGTSHSATAKEYAGNIQIEDCLNVGTVTGVTTENMMGGIIGMAGGLNSEQNVTVVIVNSYTSVKSIIGTDAGASVTASTFVSYDDLSGDKCLESTTLDFVTETNLDGYWVKVTGAVPKLSYFAN